MHALVPVLSKLGLAVDPAVAAEESTKWASTPLVILYVFLIVMVLGAFGHFTGLIGEAADSSYKLWFVVGFLFGIFGAAAAGIFYLVESRRGGSDAQQPGHPDARAYVAQGLPPDHSYQQPGHYENPQPPLRAQRIETPNPEVRGMTRCSRCGADNPTHLQECWRCNEPLGSTVMAMKRCPNCQTELPGEAAFCMICGITIPATD